VPEVTSQLGIHPRPTTEQRIHCQHAMQGKTQGHQSAQSDRHSSRNGNYSLIISSQVEISLYANQQRLSERHQNSSSFRSPKFSAIISKRKQHAAHQTDRRTQQELHEAAVRDLPSELPTTRFTPTTATDKTAAHHHKHHLLCGATADADIPPLPSGPAQLAAADGSPSPRPSLPLTHRCKRRFFLTFFRSSLLLPLFFQLEILKTREALRVESLRPKIVPRALVNEGPVSGISSYACTYRLNSLTDGSNRTATHMSAKKQLCSSVCNGVRVGPP
jgi:hypothetical protein